MSQTTLRVLVRVSGTHNRVRHLNPILAIFLDLNAAAFRLRRKRFVTNTANSTVTPELAETNSYCRLEPWTVSFSSDLNWYPRFIVEPESYQANKCVGECPRVPMDNYFNVTNHAILKYFTNNKLCCVPIEYRSQSLMFFNEVYAIQTISKMTVTRCGCR
jgi:hypothetical protein